MSNKVKVIKFSAPWCGPCKSLKPIWSELVEQFNGHSSIELVDVNVDDNPEISERYSIRSIPTIVYLKNDEEVHRLNGLSTKKVIEDKIGELYST